MMINCNLTVMSVSRYRWRWVRQSSPNNHVTTLTLTQVTWRDGLPLQKQTCYKRIIPFSKDVLVLVFASVSGISLLPRASFSRWHGRPHLGPVGRVIHIDSYFVTQKCPFSISNFPYQLLIPYQIFNSQSF